MKKQLSVTLIQSQLYWENPAANRAYFSEAFESIPNDTDLLVLAEMFTTGFSMNAENLAEDENGPTLLWMISEAKKHTTAITGSVIIKEHDLFYNRLYFVYPDGTHKHYNKKHTFTLAKEHKTYTAGSNKLILDYKGWKICPLICYDLRFPVWARNVEDYDVLIFVANWPKVRITAWDTLLKARAIENMCYCVGVNRIGLDGNNYEYNGHSAVYDVLGTQISSANFETTMIETVILQKDDLQKHRDHLQFLKDRDEFNLK